MFPYILGCQRFLHLLGCIQAVSEILSCFFLQKYPIFLILSFYCRLGIKPYVWQTECLRGQVHSNTTAFPQALGLAASWR